MRILVAGDVHGNYPWLLKLGKIAQKQQCDRIVQVGDFGFVPWPGGNEHLLKAVSDEVTRLGVKLFWLDGNHENYDLMAGLGAVTDAPNMVELEPNIFYLSRGLTWTWDECRFLSLGGAVSIDQNMRSRYVSWWPQEAITSADVERSVGDGSPVDVMFSHDVPEGAQSTLQTALDDTAPMFREKLNRECVNSRLAISEVVSARQPKVLIHGHYHYAYRGTFRNTLLVGLAHEGNPNSWVVLDTEDWRR